jgi:hypothetical protein
MSNNDKKDIERRIEAYVPRDIPTPVWEGKLRPFVIPTLHAAAPVGMAAMERFARVLTLIAAWCLKEGIPLDIEVVLDPDTVERFCSKGLKKTASRSSYRATLRKLGRELTTTAPWEPRPEPMPARLPAPPYSETELAALIGDTIRQSTAGRRRKAQALIVLGVGAGLDGRWARKVRGIDVVRLGWGVGVKVGAPSPRVVPVLAAYEEEIVRLTEQAGDEYLVGGRTTHRNRTNEIAARFEEGHNHPKLSSPRLRSTWIVTHLTLGTRLPELLAAAGTTRIETFDALLRYVPEMDPSKALDMLRGSE